MNKNLYNLLQNNSQNQSFTSTQQIPNILHDMLKSSPPPSMSNTNDNNFNSGKKKNVCLFVFPSN
jgi:hypothetical protein